MMNITLSVDENVAERARQAAQAMGKSLNQVMRDFLEQLAGAQQVQAEVQSFEASTRATPGRLGGWRFNRDDANARR